MVKPEELRKGNVVYYNGKLRKVAGLGRNYAIVDELNKEIGYTPFFDELEPVPLSPELLGKLGFVKEGRYAIGAGGFNVFVHPSTKYFTLLAVKRGTGTFSVSMGHRELSTLHDLQNAFYSFTGQELTLPNL